jgi:RNA polymerase sigma-70 factor (ECF subfamily)
MPMPHSLELFLSGVVSTQAEQDDTQLVKASRHGTRMPLPSLYKDISAASSIRVCARMLQDDEEASEITQEAFFAAWQGLPSFRGEARFATWLYRIAYQCCVRQLERRKRERALQAVVQAEQVPEGMNKEKQGEDILELCDRQAVVREQMEQLSTRYRMVLILRHLQGMSYEEMAEVLAMPVGTIKTHLFRARDLLKERLYNAISNAP